MPLLKVLFKPGVNRENTRYTTEGGWYECDKIRFRQGNPESLGGWVPYALNTFQGVCRSLWNWMTLTGQNLIGVGTNLKFYINQGGAFNDVTPLRKTVNPMISDPFLADGTNTVLVTDASHGCSVGDFVVFSGATGTYASVLNAEFRVTPVTANTYTIATPSALVAGSYGGAAVVAEYQLNVGPDVAVPLTGWGSGSWGSGPWGIGTPSATNYVIRLWAQQNYGEDLVYGPRNGGLYYWQPAGLVYNRGVLLNTLGGTVTFTTASPTVATFTTPLTEGTAVQFGVSSGGTLPTGVNPLTTYTLFNVSGVTANLLDASGNLVNVTGAGSGTFSVSLLVDVPTLQNGVSVSDTSRFVFALGCNDYGSAVLDPMLIRWSDQDNIYVWSPDATNQAGSVRLSYGSEIIAYVQARQELIVFTDSAVYGLQYVGAPVVWSSSILGDNVSIAGPNAAIPASGVIYWMGVDKFYIYDGRVQTLNCDLRRFIFSDFNVAQRAQVACGTNEGFNEVWWHYCSANSNQIDRYVIYNYLEKIWYYGTLGRTSWLDSGLQPVPLATTYDPVAKTGRIIAHETGLDDNTDGVAGPLNAYIASSEFDIGDGHNFGFVWRVLPDLTFVNSVNSPGMVTPRVTMTLTGLTSSGSGPMQTASGLVARANSYLLTEEYTGQIYTRIRGRQLQFRIESDQVGTAWQLGAPRFDVRPDGRR